MRSRVILRAATVVGILTLLPSSLASADALVGGAVPQVTLWHGSATQTTTSVPGKAAAKPSLTSAQKAADARAATPYKVPKAAWPTGSASVTLAPGTKPAGSHTSAPMAGAAKQAGSLPVALAGADTSANAAKAAQVTFSSRAAAAAAGVNGVIFTVSRSDGGSAASPTQVNLNYAAFSGAYGGGYADRLKLVELPACALTTPQLAKCRVQSPVKFANNLKSGTLTATVPVGAAAPTAQAVGAGTVSQGSATVLAATSSASGSVGSYTATSLSPAGSWSAGGNTGGFTYNYPVTVPPTVGGTAPNVTLGYNSTSVDGRTSATSAQASWIGDGWDYTPGFIERSYQSCSQDGITNATDLCWGGNIVNISLAGHSGALVRDDTTGKWHLQGDDATQVIPVTGANNGAWLGEAWEIITPDGTRYYFGENHLPGGSGSDAATNSAWTEPVYCPKSGDGPSGNTCYNSSTGTNSFETNMAWRWNLDYVVDPHGNLQTYTWTPETNYYDRGYVQGNGTGTNTLYTRGGYLSQIAYGYRLTDAISGTKPTDTVTFNVAERCNPGYANCTYSYLTSNLTSTSVTSNWPDVPADQICTTQTGTCSNYSPSFFTTKLLSSITTQVLVGSTYNTADTYTLTQMFPSPQAGVVSSPVSANQGDGTVAVLWLSSIQHTGNDTLGGGSAASTPPITFVADMMANRVDGTTTGAAALYRPRMDSITTETGAQIVVSYASPNCSRVNNTMPASPDSDTMDCYAQYWTPTDGTGPVLDWFNIYPVTEVTVNDLVAPAAWSEAQITQYSYAGPAYHRDDSPLTPNAQRTWDQFRGFRTVTTTNGVAGAQDVPTQTVSTYMQGMDGDYKADGTQRSVTVPDSVGDNVTDSNWLQGQVLETDALSGVGGSAVKKTVSGPWTFTTTATEAQADSMPALTARMTATARSRGYQLWHDGTWKSTQTDTTYDSSGRVSTADAKGDGTSAVPEVCTTNSYATSTSSTPNMLAYPDEIKSVQAACGTTATSANTVSDTRTFYDGSTTLGALTSAGDATQTQAVDSYNTSGAPVYVTESQTVYDVYGRVTSSTDADNHTTTTAYTAPGASPDTVTVTNPMLPTGWTTTSTLDPARNLATASTDVNGELTSKTYDGLGRVTAVWSPLHAKASSAPADETYSYAVSNTNVPTAITTETLRDDGSYTPSVKIYDAQDRLIQVQAPTTDNEVGRLITDTHYNSLGQTVKTTDAYYDKTTSPSTTLFQVANDSVVPAEAETFYDGLGRTVKTLTVAYGVNQFARTTAYPGVDETDTTPPTGGTATSTFTDALGRTIASWAYNTATPTGKASDAAVTSYTYTPDGNTATVTDAVGNKWTYGYDLHGRQTSLVDPSAGTSSSTYSPGGETLSTTDGDGNQLSYSYDALGRKTAEYNTTGNVAESATNEQAAWTYDTLEKGQPTAQIRYTNGASDATHTYTEAVTGYTVLYQSTGESTTIPSAEGALAGTYSITHQYTTDTSLLAGTHYNAEGGLPREQVNDAYTLSGALNAFGGTYTYLDATTYTPQGQVLQTTFGASGSQLQQTETYDAATNRELTSNDALQTMTGALSTTSYTYNQAGALTSASTSQHGVTTPDTQCYSYDQQNRLTQAFTSTDPVNDPTSGQIQGTGACQDNAPVAGKVTGGPAPYWQTYSYDALGDRVQQVNHDTSVTSTTNNVTQALAYTGYNASTGTTSAATTPDAVQSVATTGPSGTTTSTYSYDTAGDTKTRSGQAFTYDAEGHTQAVTNTATGTSSTYTYAADGSLLIQRDPASNQVIAYLPYGEQLTLNTGNGAVAGQRYYTASPDGITVVRETGGTVYYELTDKLGTATAEVNTATLAYNFRYFDPYGNQIAGTAQSAWADQHAYLGKAQDPATSLVLLGAREYDPVTGRFLSVDPVLEAGDQTQMNGYAYSGDDPVNSSDPTGQTRGDVDGQEAKYESSESDSSTSYTDYENQLIGQAVTDSCGGRMGMCMATRDREEMNNPVLGGELIAQANEHAEAIGVARQKSEDAAAAAASCNLWCSVKDHASSAWNGAVHVNEDLGRWTSDALTIVGDAAPALDVLALATAAIPGVDALTAGLAIAATTADAIGAATATYTFGHDLKTGASWEQTAFDGAAALASLVGMSALAKSAADTVKLARMSGEASRAMGSGNLALKSVNAMMGASTQVSGAAASYNVALATSAQMGTLSDMYSLAGAANCDASCS